MSKVGRPKADNPRSLTISETRVTKEEYRMIALKSALYAGGSTAKFIRMAAEAYEGQVQGQMKCQCGESASLHYGKERFQVKDRTITVENVPEYRCTCGEVLADLTLSATIEKEVENFATEYLAKHQKFPDKLDLKDLLVLKH